jgi:glycogen synthase
MMRAAMARDFSWERSGRRYLEVYQAVLNGAGPAPRG